MRNLPAIIGFCFRAALTAMPILAALVFLVVPFAARSDETAITGLRIISEASDQLVVEVQYRRIRSRYRFKPSQVPACRQPTLFRQWILSPGWGVV